MRTTFSTLKLEGGLIGHDIIERIVAGEECGQKPPDFGFDSRSRLSDEIAAAWSDARDLWHIFERRLERLPQDDLATTATRDQWVIPLLSSFGYELIYQPRAAEIDGLTFSISHKAGKDDAGPPVHIVGARQSLDRKPESGRPRLAPHALLQEYINRTDQVWGIVTNGKILRILRDSQRMRKQAYIEFDLDQLMEGEKFADFTLLYRLLHKTRLPQTLADAHECFLEKYYLLTIEQGGRVRDRLRDGVEEALKIFANGFINNPQNNDLRQDISSGNLAPQHFYRQLLRLIYRFLFLMVAEERNLITDNAIYAEHYSISRLRHLLEIRSSWTSHDDLWLGLRTTFALFREEKLGQYLNVPPLNGDLFNSTEMTSLVDASLANRELLNALWHLGMYQEDERSPWHRINYAALDVEELGSVYESLLEFHPVFVEKDGESKFDLVYGTERKSTGSYYTPPELVQELIKSALVPVIEERFKNASSKDDALLSIRVLDPACGSGHFLLAAARRLGKDLAKARTGEEEPTPESLRLAIRDVITHCIYGVDKNPLAVDLCKVALWIEGHAKDKPLTFLDHRIRCGDSLIGVMDLNVLKDGIPDEAFIPAGGDDKSAARSIKIRNKEEREGQRSLPFEVARELRDLGYHLGILSQIPDDTSDNIRKKSDGYRKLHSLGTKWWKDQTACNLWTAAFFIELTPENERENRIPTYETLMNYFDSGAADGRTTGYAWFLAQKYAFFHWPLEFPEAFVQGGFDVVLGNPPWAQVQLDEKDFFATKDQGIAELSGEKRKQKIRELNTFNPELGGKYRSLKAAIEKYSNFAKKGGRYKFVISGKLNTYALFAELFSQLLIINGRAGLICPTGLITDEGMTDFLAHLLKERRLISVFDFSNKKGIFNSIEKNIRFSLVSLGRNELDQIYFGAQLERIEDIYKSDKTYLISGSIIENINPNTKGCPTFQTSKDAGFVEKMYEMIPVFVLEGKKGKNPWNVEFRQGLFNITSASRDFKIYEELLEAGYKLLGNIFIHNRVRYLPLYEAKLFHQYNHRESTFEGTERKNRFKIHAGANRFEKRLLVKPDSVVLPRYWVAEKNVKEKLWVNSSWFLGCRKAISATADSRSLIATILPWAGIGDSVPLILTKGDAIKAALILGMLNSVLLDYILKQKTTGGNLNHFILKQLPIIPFDDITVEVVDFVIPKITELVYVSWDIKSFADDIWRKANDKQKYIISAQAEENRVKTGGNTWNPPEWAEILNEGIPLPPFKWDENRRAKIRAELDVYYAKLYGLTKDDLHYILDPKDVYGPDFPGETFRVLKEKEEREYGEYRTKRLILEGWDK